MADAKTMDNKNLLIRWKQPKHIDLVLCLILWAAVTRKRGTAR